MLIPSRTYESSIFLYLDFLLIRVIQLVLNVFVRYPSDTHTRSRAPTSTFPSSLSDHVLYCTVLKSQLSFFWVIFSI